MYGLMLKNVSLAELDCFETPRYANRLCDPGCGRNMCLQAEEQLSALASTEGMQKAALQLKVADVERKYAQEVEAAEAAHQATENLRVRRVKGWFGGCTPPACSFYCLYVVRAADRPTLFCLEPVSCRSYCMYMFCQLISDLQRVLCMTRIFASAGSD